MTLVMAWREHEMQRVWLVSDSRLSNTGQHGRTQLTDNAAKLLVAPRILRRQTPMNVLGVPVLSSDVAFAYAGSSLIALQAYAAILPLWGHRQAIGEEALPSMRACAEHLGIFVRAYTMSVSSASGQLQACQCAIVGFDHPSQSVEGWIVSTFEQDGAIVAVVRRMTIDPGDIELIGSGANAAREALAQDFPCAGALWHREPLAMIRAHLPVLFPRTEDSAVTRVPSQLVESCRRPMRFPDTRPEIGTSITRSTARCAACRWSS